MIYYFIGIKGSGMSALAKVLYEQGHIVLGVDVEESFYTEKNLKDIKIESFKHMNLKPSYFYIVGNAYIEHSVSRYIMHMKYKYQTYPVFIMEYFKKYNFISVCGSHGKTTTTKFISMILPDSSYIIGDGTGCGKGMKNFILESCEYRNTFLNYTPRIALVLNMDYDHPDFFKTEEEYIASYQKFLYSAMVVVACGDDVNVRKIKENRFITYGMNSGNDITFEVTYETSGMQIQILGTSFFIPFLGLHYAYDFVGAYLVSKLFGVEDTELLEKSRRLKLPKRRMECIEKEKWAYVHDYAHHPTEIKCVYESLRLKYPKYQLICIFQPHTLSRSVSLLDEFKQSLDLYDKVYLLRTFTSMREDMNIQKEHQIFQSWGYEVLSKVKVNHIKKQANYCYVFLGAGDIDQVFQVFSQN